MPPASRPKKQAEEGAPKPAPKAQGSKGAKSLLTMELARTASRGSTAISLEDIKAQVQERVLSLNKAAEAGMNEEIDACITNGVAAIVAKAKDHHVYVNEELKISMDLQDQVKAEHGRAVGDVRRMAAEAGQVIEHDTELNDIVKRTREATQNEIMTLQRKYLH